MSDISERRAQRRERQANRQGSGAREHRRHRRYHRDREHHAGWVHERTAAPSPGHRRGRRADDGQNGAAHQHLAAGVAHKSYGQRDQAGNEARVEQRRCEYRPPGAAPCNQSCYWSSLLTAGAKLELSADGESDGQHQPWPGPIGCPSGPAHEHQPEPEGSPERSDRCTRDAGTAQLGCEPACQEPVGKRSGKPRPGDSSLRAPDQPAQRENRGDICRVVTPTRPPDSNSVEGVRHGKRHQPHAVPGRIPGRPGEREEIGNWGEPCSYHRQQWLGLHARTQCVHTDAQPPRGSDRILGNRAAVCVELESEHSQERRWGGDKR